MLASLKSNKRLWELFTKQEEYGSNVLDKYQRFSYSRSKHRNVLEPEVSIYLSSNGVNYCYPDDRRFAVCLTHDIDEVNFPLKKIGINTLRSLRRGNINMAFKTFEKIRNWNADPGLCFDEIITIEKEYDAKSSFYIKAFDEIDLDFNYDLSELSDQLKSINKKGWEIGLHGSHKAYNNLNKLKKEKMKLEEILGEKIIGFRNHYLRFKTPITWEILRKAGFRYDTTFGYHDHVGFRNGMCHPFKPYNLKTDKYIDILEIPLIIMDRTLYHAMKLDLKKAWKTTKRLIDTVERYQGVITILWHNTYMIDRMLEFYEDILEYCHDKEAWLTSGANIWKWWNEIEVP